MKREWNVQRKYKRWQKRWPLKAAQTSQEIRRRALVWLHWTLNNYLMRAKERERSDIDFIGAKVFHCTRFKLCTLAHEQEVEWKRCDAFGHVWVSLFLCVCETFDKFSSRRKNPLSLSSCWCDWSDDSLENWWNIANSFNTFFSLVFFHCVGGLIDWRSIRRNASTFSSKHTWFVSFYVSAESMFVSNVVDHSVDAVFVFVTVRTFHFMRMRTLFMAVLGVAVAVFHILQQSACISFYNEEWKCGLSEETYVSKTVWHVMTVMFVMVFIVMSMSVRVVASKNQGKSEGGNHNGAGEKLKRKVSEKFDKFLGKRERERERDR